MSYVSAWKRLVADRRGSGDVLTWTLLSAAGLGMLMAVLPGLYGSSQTSANTFQNQVNTLATGAGGQGGQGGQGGAQAGH